ncbi:TRPM8 channel-associated factor homolog [Mantella aurantiaca]
MNPKESYKALVKNIKSLNFIEEAVPCDLLLSGDSAFPVIVNPSGQVLIAASQYGLGRLVVMGHENYVKSPNFTQFIENAIEWLKPTADSIVGIHEKFSSVVQILSDKGHAVESAIEFNDRFGVYCMHAYDDKQSNELIAALKQGKGLLIAGQAWYWMIQNKLKNVVLDFPGNKVTSVAGIHFLSDYGQKGEYEPTPQIPISSLMAKYNWDLSKDLHQLLKDLTEVHLPKSGFPSHLIVHGQRAFPLIVNDSYKTYLAAAFYGKGRVVVATHEHQISQASQKQLVSNLISWLDAGRKGGIGIHWNLREMLGFLEEGLEIHQSDFKKSFSVYCCTSYTDKDAENMLEFVAEGGGLLIAGQAWHWASLNPGKDALIEYPGNKLINQFGISILGAGADPGCLHIINTEDHSRGYQCRKAFYQLKMLMDTSQEMKEPLASWMRKLSEDCATLLAVREQDKQTFYQYKGVLINTLLKYGLPQVGPDLPVKGGSKEAFLLSVAAGLYNTLPDFESIATKLIPGTSLPVSPPQTLQINCTSKANTVMLSTGLYVPPGRTSTLIFPESAINIGLQVQIGCHTDNLSHHSELRRAPVVVQKYAIDKVTLPVSTMFGGLIYITVPGRCHLGSIQICIQDAVLAPYFNHGETSDSSWVDMVYNYPSPWVELETENIILSVPSNLVSNLESPSETLAVWDKIMEAVLKLSAMPPVLERKERIVADTQISQGWMHSGYPIMVHLKSAEALVQVENIKPDMWGLLHELGHNWEIGKCAIPPHTDEALCNLWAVYVYENVLAIPREKAHGDLKPRVREERIWKYLKSGAQLENWNTWVCLETYLQLQEGFGWEPYIKLFSHYRDVKEIKNDTTLRMNLWAELFSQQAQRNLVPFFKAWGWPIEEELSDRLSSLPEWQENPMKKYTL